MQVYVRAESDLLDSTAIPNAGGYVSDMERSHASAAGGAPPVLLSRATLDSKLRARM